MLTRFFNSFRTEDDKDPTFVRLIRNSLIVLIIMNFFAAVLISGLGENTRRFVYLIIGIIFIGESVALYFVLKGNLVIGKILLPLLLLLAVTASTANQGGMQSISIMHYGTILIFSTILLGRRATFLVLPLMVLSYIYLAYMELTGQTILEDGSIAIAILGSVFLLTLGATNHFLASRLQYQIDKARTNESDQKQKNIELNELKNTLETRVQERTQDLEKANEINAKRASRLQAISDISQEIVTNISNQPDEVFEKITTTISQKLGFYHVGIFLLDKNKEFAVLRATNSPGGKQMLARQHQLKVGATGIVGYVTQSGRPRIALDTSADVIYFNNPDLPETRSEISLPLKYGETIIGALDVQSTQPSAFSDEDVDILSTLANQVAIVIKNLQITEESKSYSLNRMGKISKREMESGYTFQTDGSIIATKLPIDNSLLQKVSASGETVILSPSSKNQQSTMAVPVKFREHIVGVIHIEVKDNKKKWTDDEIAFIQAISERAALALENARLLEESQRRAAKEQAIGEISTKISAYTDIEAILRTAVRELGTQISGTQITVEIGSDTDNLKT